MDCLLIYQFSYRFVLQLSCLIFQILYQTSFRILTRTCNKEDLKPFINFHFDFHKFYKRSLYLYSMIGIIAWIVIALIAIIVIAFIMYFNRFVVLGNRIDNSLSQIDVQLRKRADLVPNLIATVKGYAKHEKDIMKDVTDARKALVGAKDFKGRVRAGGQLQEALRSVFAIAENYPQLKANENFLQLQQELSAIEDKVAYARQYYNDSILTYNNSVETFPGKMFASLFGKAKKEYLEIPAEQKAVPKVSF